MKSGDDEGGVPLSMIPLLEVAYSKCQEAEHDTPLLLYDSPGQHPPQEESAGKKRKRSSNWSEAETLQLLTLRKAQLLNKDERRICPKGSSAWDEIAFQLQEHFTARSGKHVGERWDTLRRVYMDIEERSSKTKESYAEILDSNRELLKFIPSEYTQRWHELIADCKPGKRRGKRLIIDSGSSSQKVASSPLSLAEPPPPVKAGRIVEDFSVTSYRHPVEAGSEEGTVMHGRAECVQQHESSHSLGIASAFGSLIKDIERVIISGQTKQDKSCGRKYARRGTVVEANGVEMESEDNGDAGEVNVVASLQSVLSALKSASEFTSSESYLLKIDKREWNLVEHNVRAFSERHRNIEQPRINGYGKSFGKFVWPPDDQDPITITHDDVKSLEPGGQLSDNIVNFYLKYLLCVNNTRIPDVQIFRTFTKQVSANLNAVRYGSVRSWMKSIFDKSYVVIPVFKDEQWSLIVICYPGRPIAGRKSGIAAPCILHLNPSRQKSHQDLERHMRFILHSEWLWHHGVHVAPRDISQIPFFPVAVPQQENCDDTGLLILQYAELFLKNGPETFSLAQSGGFPFLTDWWEPSTATTMRAAIRQVLLHMESQSESLQKQADSMRW